MLNIKQQQSFLRRCNGLYGGKIDGVKGKLTVKAIKAFQALHGLKQDGVFGVKTNETALKILWRRYPNFNRKEFICKCGKCNGDVEMYEELLEILQAIRNKYKKPVTVTSGIRCAKHNKNVGGVSNSRHLKGKAADIKIKGVSGAELKKAAYKYGCRYSYVIVNDTVHIDIK